jgi:hypothetical protein
VADHDRGDDQDGGGALAVEGERAEGDQPGAGQPDVVGDVAGLGQPAPPLLCQLEAVVAAAVGGQVEARGLAPADQALTGGDPRQRAVLGQQVEQRSRVVAAHGGGREQRERGSGGHTPG